MDRKTHYYIDGYNLLFHLPKEAASLEQGRKEIIDSLSDTDLSITIVFDGKGTDHASRSHKGSLEIIYTTKGQSADSYILEELSFVKNPKAYTIVTSDKKLATVCCQSGAKAQSISSFLEAIHKKELKSREKVREKPFKESSREYERLLKIFTALDQENS